MRMWVCCVCVLVCATANAATMCVPDLSTCESCVPITRGVLWVADCCGTRVSGVEISSGYFGGRAWSGKASRNLTTDFYDLVNGDVFETYCIMTAPVFAKYITFVGCSSATPALAGNCAENFKPKCALTECDEIITCNNGSWD